MNIFVAKLDYSIQEPELKEVFQDYGDVSSVKIITDKFTGRSKGFGFIEMDSEDEGNAAIDALDGVELEGRAIVVKVAKPQESRDRGSDNRRNDFNRW